MSDAENRCTVGVGGYGLLLAPACPCRIALLDNGALLFGSFDGDPDRYVIVRPGTEPASGDPIPGIFGEEVSGVRFGDSGPTLGFGKGISDLGDLFVRVETGLPQSPWMLLSAGFWIAFPPGLTLFAADPSDSDPFFELHLASDQETFISFEARPAPPATILVNAPADWRTTGEGAIEADGQAVRWVEYAYEHDGIPWRQRRYLLPFSTESTLLMIAQAREPSAAHLFDRAHLVAETFAPVDEE